MLWGTNKYIRWHSFIILERKSSERVCEVFLCSLEINSFFTWYFKIKLSKLFDYGRRVLVKQPPMNSFLKRDIEERLNLIFFRCWKNHFSKHKAVLSKCRDVPGHQVFTRNCFTFCLQNLLYQKKYFALPKLTNFNHFYRLLYQFITCKSVWTQSIARMSQL